MSRAWIRQRERGSPFAIQVILWVAQHIGRPVARVLLYPITFYFLLTATTPRRASRHYLGRILGRPATLRDVARHIHTFSATILDRVFFLTNQFQHFEFRFHGLDDVLARANSGQGCLLLGAHVGSFEVLRAVAVGHTPIPIKVLMYPQVNEYLNRLFNSLNPEIAETVIPLGGVDSLLRVKEALEQGTMVGMLGDRIAESEKVTRCRFLGEEVPFPAGPALLASSLGVPVILVLGLYRGGNRYDLHFELLSDTLTLPREGREEAIREWTQRYADRLAHHLVTAPNNWFNFYDYWQDDASGNG